MGHVAADRFALTVRALGVGRVIDHGRLVAAELVENDAELAGLKILERGGGGGLRAVQGDAHHRPRRLHHAVGAKHAGNHSAMESQVQ